MRVNEINMQRLQKLVKAVNVAEQAQYATFGAGPNCPTASAGEAAAVAKAFKDALRNLEKYLGLYLEEVAYEYLIHFMTPELLLDSLIRRENELDYIERHQKTVRQNQPSKTEQEN